MTGIQAGFRAGFDSLVSQAIQCQILKCLRSGAKEKKHIRKDIVIEVARSLGRPAETSEISSRSPRAEKLRGDNLNMLDLR